MLILAWRLGGTARYPLHRGTLARREVVFDRFHSFVSCTDDTRLEIHAVYQLAIMILYSELCKAEVRNIAHGRIGLDLNFINVRPTRDLAPCHVAPAGATLMTSPCFIVRLLLFSIRLPSLPASPSFGAYIPYVLLLAFSL
jgi:hypothetical protein